MKVILFGAGNVGKAIVKDLAEEVEMHIADVDEVKLSYLEGHGDTHLIDVSQKDKVREFISDFDLVISSVPGKFGYELLEQSVEAGVDAVDVSFMPEDPFSLDNGARKKGVSLVVDAGFGPGISNVFVGRLSELMDMEECFIRICGLPENPEPPLYYTSTWSPVDLIEEYTRPARQVHNGQIVELDPLEEINKVNICGLELEEFYSDGLRTLLKTIEVDRLEETTLRWPGHLDKMKVLRDLGFFDEEHLQSTLEVLLPLMHIPGKDFSLLKVEAIGTTGEKMEYTLWDTAKDGLSSMARTTGFTTALIARYVLEGRFEPGVVPPELVGRKPELYDRFIDGLMSRGIEIKECTK